MSARTVTNRMADILTNLFGYGNAGHLGFHRARPLIESLCARHGALFQEAGPIKVFIMSASQQ
jgi:hypothetical protein